MEKKESRYWLLGMTCLSLVLTVFSLGDQFFWFDEGETLVLAANILERGLPYAQSSQFQLCPNLGLTPDGLWTAQPWVQFYVASTALQLFGKSVFWLRLPFAFIGVTCVPLVWMLCERLKVESKVQILATFFCATNVSLILLFRNVRYYPIAVCFTLVLLILYLDLCAGWRRRWISFGLVSGLFMHTMPPVCAAVIAAIFLHSLLIARVPRVLTALVKSQLIMLIFFLPWLIYSWDGLKEFYRLRAVSTLGNNLSVNQFIIGIALYLTHLAHYHFPLLLFFVCIGFAVTGLRWKFTQTIRREAVFLLLFVVGFICVSMAFMFNSNLWSGYVSAAIPLVLILSACVVTIVSRNRTTPLVILSLIFVATNLLNLPHLPRFGNEPPRLKEETLDQKRFRILKNQVFHSPFEILLPRYLTELVTPYTGPVEEIVRFLEAHKEKGDTFASANDGPTIQFMTGLKREMQVPFAAPPTWIIPRGMSTWRKGFCELNELDANQYVSQFLMNEKYVPIMLEAPDLYHENEPVMPHHHFVTPPLDRKVVIFHHGPLGETKGEKI